MKNNICATVFSAVACIFGFCGTSLAQTESSKLNTTILQMDSIFWKGYNGCDTSLCASFVAK